MAIKSGSRTKANKYARKYYKDNKTYRDKKIEARKRYAKTHHEEEADYSRDYYHTHPTYKRYKVNYARDYRKAHHSRKRK